MRAWYSFFFNDTATTEIYTLSLHDALPISRCRRRAPKSPARCHSRCTPRQASTTDIRWRRAGLFGRSEEHTSELQSHLNLVCRLLLEKKKNWNLLLIVEPPSTVYVTKLQSA